MVRYTPVRASNSEVFELIDLGVVVGRGEAQPQQVPVPIPSERRIPPRSQWQVYRDLVREHWGPVFWTSLVLLTISILLNGYLLIKLGELFHA